jgi:hypothetical protein
MVDVVFDPADILELSIEYEGHAPWCVRELVIGERAGKRPPQPEHLGPVPADASRLLAGAEEQYRNRKAPAVACKEAMFESFYSLGRSSFSRDVPTSKLFESIIL